MIMRGMDWSNYTGVPTPEQIANAIAQGYTWVILGTQRPTITRQQAAACAFAGLEVRGLYCFVYWNDGDFARVDQARILADDLGLKVWMDYEWECEQQYDVIGVPDAPTPDLTALTIAMAGFHKQLGVDRLAGIYTGAWWWNKHINSAAFALPLWHASYPYGQTIPPADYPHLIPSAGYGGWGQPAMWQYSSAGETALRFVCDLNAADEIAPVPAPAPTEDIFHALVRTLATDYRVVDAGANPIGQRVAHVEQADGSDANPGIYIAIKSQEES